MSFKLKCLGIVLFAFYTVFLWQQLGNDLLISETKGIEKTPVEIIKEDKVDQLVTVFRTSSEVVIPLEEYLIGVVASEMPVSFEKEALKAQAVAARTFVVKRSFSVDDTTSSQVYKSEEELRNQWGDKYEEYNQKIQEAIDQTKGEILTYEGEAITAAFFSSSNGMSNNAEDYWVSETPYLKAVDSHWDNEREGNERIFDFTPNEIANALNVASGNNLRVSSTFPNGYVAEVEADGVIFSGRAIREALKLSSSSFTITSNGDRIQFNCLGSGHGIGMSQYGANGMALEGYDYQSILLHYYQGVKISDIVYN